MLAKLVFLQVCYHLVSTRDAVLIGGGSLAENQIFLEKFVQISQKPYGTRIGIISEIASNPEKTANEYIQYFSQFTAEEVEWISLKSTVDNSILAQNIQGLTGIFFTDGDPKNYQTAFFNVDNETLAENVLITLIRERYNDGLLALGGLGFGAMIQQFGPLILNGESYEALYYGPYTRYDEDFSNDLVYTSLGGLNLAFSFGLLDVEFASKGRIGRILEIGAYLKPRGIEVNFGFGLDDQTALHIMESVITVLGDNGLSVIDFSGSHIHDYDIDGIKYSYIKSGDVIVFEDNFIRPLPHPLRKILPCSQNSTYFGLFSKDILSSLSNSNKDGTRENPGEFVKMVNRFARDDLETISAITYENDPSFKLALTKNDKSFIVVQEQTGEANISLYSVNLSIQHNMKALST